MPAAAPAPNSAWQRAVAFAARKHKNQLRKDGVTPYVSHVYRVAMTVRHVFNFDDQATLLAALLHDTIEDTTTDYDELEEHFGRDVADLVASLTKNMALPEAARETEYDARLAKADWRARVIKLADVYDNLCDWSPATGMRREHLLEKCQRALELTASDAKHEVMRVARQVVSQAMGELDR